MLGRKQQVVEENWDDDFEFGNSPRNSPVPTTAPIHHLVHKTRSQNYHARSNTDLHSQSSREGGFRTASRTNLQRAALSSTRIAHPPPSSAHLAVISKDRKARWSGNSEEDWDLEEADTTMKAPPQLPQTSAAPHASSHAQSHSSHNRASTDQESQIVHFNSRRSPSPSGNASPTMSAFSIPLSATSSIRHHAAPSIGGSSTNFLLHNGRRSVMEIEKSRHDRERRRLRKKSRPSGGATQMEDGFDSSDIPASSGQKLVIPRRYAVGGGRDAHSSSESDDSGGELSELEEEASGPGPATLNKAVAAAAAAAAANTSSAGTTQTPSRAPVQLKPTSSRPTLASVLSPRGSTAPSTSGTRTPAAPPSGSGAQSGPSKLIRKSSNLSKTASPVIGTQQLKPKSSIPLSSTSNVPQMQISPARSATSGPSLPPTSPPRSVLELRAAAQPRHDGSEDGHVNDCGSSIAGSSHKARTPILARLSGLKRWSKSPSLGASSKLPSLGSTTAFPTSPSTTDVTSTPGLKSSSGSIRAKTLGLVRRASQTFRNNDEPTPSTSTSNAAASPSGNDEGRRGMNPFRRVSLTGMKRLVTDHHHHPPSRLSTEQTRDGDDEAEQPPQTLLELAAAKRAAAAKAEAQKQEERQKEKERKREEKEKEKAEHGGKTTSHLRNSLNFASRLRSKSGGNDGKTEVASNVHKDAGANIGVARAPHTLGRTAALAKAPKPPVKSLMSGVASSSDDTSSLSASPASSRPRQQLPPVPTDSKPRSSATPSKSAADSISRGTSRRREEGSTRHTREGTARPPLSTTSASKSSSSGAQLDSTPRAFNSVKALPPTADSRAAIPAEYRMTNTADDRASLTPTTAATMGRAMGATVQEKKEPRRSSVGEAQRHAHGSSSRRGGELRIPSRISMKQGALKRELEAVKEFASSVEELKRFQSTYHDILNSLPASRRNTSSRSAARQLAAVENVSSQYALWWECAELLVELGGAAPPTVAGTPIHEDIPASTSAYSTSGTQRSFSSTSSHGDLSHRQLNLLRQMLSTPNPRSFNEAIASINPSTSQATLSSQQSSRSTAEDSTRPRRPGHYRELSGSGSDHVMSDQASTTGNKSSIDSRDSHDPASMRGGNYPYYHGTWKHSVRSGTPAGTSSTTGSRPSLAGMFANSRDITPTNAPKSKDSSAYESSSSAAGQTGGDGSGSDWDAESDGDKNTSASRHLPSLPSPSTTTSSLDSLPMRLALTPENIAPLLAYAKEVKARLSECLQELGQIKNDTNNTIPMNVHAVPVAQPLASEGRRREQGSGTSTIRRA